MYRGRPLLINVAGRLRRPDPSINEDSTVFRVKEYSLQMIDSKADFQSSAVGIDNMASNEFNIIAVRVDFIA